MARMKSYNYSRKTTIIEKHHNVKENKRNKTVYVEIYPMMPRKYTAVQRAQLRKFERELYAGKKVVVE